MTIGRRQWRWRLVGGSLFLLITFSTGWLLAKQGVVTTRDGQRVEGDINEKADEVVVTSHGVNTVIARDNIASLQYSEAFEKQFQDRLAKLDPKDVNGRIEEMSAKLTDKYRPRTLAEVLGQLEIVASLQQFVAA